MLLMELLILLAPALPRASHMGTMSLSTSCAGTAGWPATYARAVVATAVGAQAEASVDGRWKIVTVATSSLLRAVYERTTLGAA